MRRISPQTLGAICIGLTLFSARQTMAIEVATGKPVTGESSSWGINNGQPGRFNAGHAVDGIITEPTANPNGSGENEWLAQENLNNQSFTIDLGGQYDLSQISLYNTHNGQFNDSRTVQFHINAGNTLAPSGNTPGTLDGAGQQLSGGTTILSGSLSNVDSQATITPDVFPVSATNVRYIQFVEDTHSGSRGGLNEIQIQGALSVPEPASISIIGLAAGTLVLRRRTH